MNAKTKSDNRRAMPKFVVTILLAAVGGGILGFGAGIVNAATLSQSISQALNGALTAMAPWGIPVTSVIFLGLGWTLYGQARNMYRAWDGEEEESIDIAERKLSWALLMSAITLLWDFFFLAVVVIYGDDLTGVAGSLTSIGVFLVSVAVAVVLQQKVVDLEKRINPEKQGSVYDVKFQKKWMDSCDESEQRQIGQACYKAFRAATQVCMWLWVALMILHYAFGTGLMPVAVVLVVLAVLQITYTLECIRLQGRKS